MWEDVKNRVKKRMSDLKKIDPMNGASLLTMDESMAGGFKATNTQDNVLDEGGRKTLVEPVEPVGTPTSRILVSLGVTIAFAAIYYYLHLPALNIHDLSLYWFLVWLCVVFSLCMVHMSGYRANDVKDYLSYTRKKLPIPIGIIAVLSCGAVLGILAGLAVFHAQSYSELISVEEGDFVNDVSEISWNQIPLLDGESANNLANRKLGELNDLVSQFSVSDLSTQINYNGVPVRVNYLDYGDIFKWWNNRGTGIPAYMCINMRTQEVSVVRLNEGIKYSPSEYFNRNLKRHLRFNYPMTLFGDINFEIDDNGTPYWVASVIEKRIGLYNGTDVKGIVLLNAVTGESRYLNVKDIPSWIDRVYSADLIVEHYNYYGKYRNGFLNSIIGQNECTEATSGYNFVAQDDDVWMYTGITSVTLDRGNIGFILVNQRTKEARYYLCAGAEEDSAKSSAQGAVQQYNYTATFPILLNISNQPTYFMALKDDASLVKMYAMVNVQQYQLVAIGNTVSDCQTNYQNLLMENNLAEGNKITEKPKPTVEELEQSLEVKTFGGVITDIRQANIEGNTVFYIKLEGSEAYYTVNVREYPITTILNIGDSVSIEFVESNETLIAVKTLHIGNN